MVNQVVKKITIFFFTTLLVLVSTFSFAVWYHEDSVQRVEFSLLNQEGAVTTQKDFAGKHMLVFFGYTSCPDICPVQLHKLSQVMKNLDETEAKLVMPVFVSVDPERDTAEMLNQYLSYFDQSLIGLTGSRASIKRVTKVFNTFLQDAPKEGDENYIVAHSSLVYVVDPFGRIIDHISFDNRVEDIVSKINDLI